MRDLDLFNAAREAGLNPERAAARPAETVSETVPTRHETPDVAELRRLLDAATARPWEWTTDLDALLGGYEGEYRVIDTAMALRSYYALRVAAEDAHLIATAVNALPSLLDQLDAAGAALARVRELHERESFWQYDRDQENSYLTQQDAADESGCDCPEDPESTYLAHTPECLATITHFDVCSECARIEYADAERQASGEFSGYAEALWPCPTIRALGGEQS